VRAPGSTALILARATFVLASMLVTASAQAGLTEAIARVKPSVVAVGTFQKTRSPPFVFRGTGFAVGDGTLIATAAHAVSEFSPSGSAAQSGAATKRCRDA